MKIEELAESMRLNLEDEIELKSTCCVGSGDHFYKFVYHSRKKTLVWIEDPSILSDKNVTRIADLKVHSYHEDYYVRNIYPVDNLLVAILDRAINHKGERKMTPLQKKRHTAELKKLCTKHGFVKINNRMEHTVFVYPGHDNFRIMFKQIVVRFEIRKNNNWISANYSETISHLSTEVFEMAVKAKASICKSRRPIKLDEHKIDARKTPIFKNHVHTAEAQEQLKTMVDKRSNLDYQAYMMLQELNKNGHIPSEFQEDVDSIVDDRLEISDRILLLIAGN